MCGIFGLLVSANSKMPFLLFKSTADSLFTLSESRGKEASGIVLNINHNFYVLKDQVAAHDFIRSNEYQQLFASTNKKKLHFSYSPAAFFGHSRLVTNGSGELNQNNQPIIKDGAVGVHNGIIVNDSELWNIYTDLKKNYDVDTEAFLALIQGLRRHNFSLIPAIQTTYKKIAGSASVGILFNDIPYAILATNTGSLYICKSSDENELIFASEKFILKRALEKRGLKDFFNKQDINQLNPGMGSIISLEDLQEWKFPLFSEIQEPIPKIPTSSPVTQIKDFSFIPTNTVPPTNFSFLYPEIKAEMIQTWERLYSGEIKLQRCIRCLLPETIPFISFNKQGVCNHCQDYEKWGNRTEGEDALAEILSKYRKRTGDPDCILGFSGGRDSSYGLYYLKKHQHMNPLTFIYDWGMVTDLARRNQARICGTLGIEQIVVSANIQKKREHIKKNLEAWLRKPDLGMVTILMAGDKEFYKYFHKIRKETGIKLFVFCGGYEGEEATGIFKLGFCGVNRNENSAIYRMTGISLKNKMKLLWYYFKNYLANPHYLNSSIFDTLLAYYWSYLLPDDYVYLYRYLPWDEETILTTIKKEFDWELEKDTIATWRTDDGTAALYNYIYLTMAGFTEYDIIRSQQIREGKLSREEALNLVKEENRPRFISIEWYAQTVGVDVNRMITLINSAHRLYQ
jgi:asparagine synthetase B (glutamine-hydrolysing)